MTAVTDDLIRMRRALHAIPEVGLNLPKTQALVLDALAGLGLDIVRGRALTSVAAVLRGGVAHRSTGERRTVLLRSDMDALPVTEHTGLAFSATNGAMHACGHDLHMAMLLSTVRELASRRDELAGDVVVVFQPGEEGHGGARLMLKEGVLGIAGTPPQAAFGMHALSYLLPARRIGVRGGPVMSGSTLVRVTFAGRGGHGSAPHLTNDPLLAGAVFIPAVTSAVCRAIDMFEPHTLTFGAFRGGESYNVIPEQVELLGTLRTFSSEVVERARTVINAVAQAVAAAHEVTADVQLVEDTVPTCSDQEEAEFASDVGGDVMTWLDRPVSVSEDFCWFLREVPGVFVLLGAQSPTADGAPPPPNHSSRAVFAESAMEVGHRLQVQWAIRRLSLPSA
jgi:amidohydrolase